MKQPRKTPKPAPRPTACACGRPGVRRCGSDWICAKCAEIEDRLNGRRKGGAL